MELAEKEKLTQMVKLVEQDRGNFELLYNFSVKKVYYWCYTILKDENLAKDLTQESMIKMYYKFDTLKNPEAFTTWLYTLVRNLCYSYLRSQRHTDTISLEEENHVKENIQEETPNHLPQDSYDLQETKKLVVDLIRKLPRKQREVITLFYLAELKLTEISLVLEKDLGTVKSRLQMGRKNLEREIEGYEKSHGTKLYSTILLPFLGEILQEDADMRFKKKELKYNSKVFRSNNFLNVQGLKGFTSLKPWVIGLTSVAIITLVGVASFVPFNFEKGQKEGRSTKAVSAFEKDESNLYIEGITRSNFATRTYTDVVIHLKKSAESKKVKVKFHGKAVPFEQKGNQVHVRPKENGVYTVTVGGTEKTFYIDQINPEAPELESVSNQGEYLELTVLDEFQQINYETSYVLYEGKTYKITENNRVLGQFHGDIKVYLYNQTGHYVYYEFNLK